MTAANSAKKRPTTSAACTAAKRIKTEDAPPNAPKAPKAQAVKPTSGPSATRRSSGPVKRRKKTPGRKPKPKPKIVETPEEREDRIIKVKAMMLGITKPVKVFLKQHCTLAQRKIQAAVERMMTRLAISDEEWEHMLDNPPQQWVTWATKQSEREGNAYIAVCKKMDEKEGVAKTAEEYNQIRAEFVKKEYEKKWNERREREIQLRKSDKRRERKNRQSFENFLNTMGAAAERWRQKERENEAKKEKARLRAERAAKAKRLKLLEAKEIQEQEKENGEEDESDEIDESEEDKDYDDDEDEIADDPEVARVIDGATIVESVPYIGIDEEDDIEDDEMVEEHLSPNSRGRRREGELEHQATLHDLPVTTAEDAQEQSVPLAANAKHGNASAEPPPSTALSNATNKDIDGGPSAGIPETMQDPNPTIKSEPTDEISTYTHAPATAPDVGSTLDTIHSTKSDSAFPDVKPSHDDDDERNTPLDPDSSLKNSTAIETHIPQTHTTALEIQPGVKTEPDPETPPVVAVTEQIAGHDEPLPTKEASPQPTSTHPATKSAQQPDPHSPLATQKLASPGIDSSATAGLKAEAEVGGGSDASGLIEESLSVAWSMLEGQGP